MKKVFSSVIGYSADYDLLHYAGGLSMWRRLTKRNIGGQYGVPLRLMLKTSTSGSGRIVFPPTTFRRRHQPARPSSKHLKDNFMKKVFSSVIGYSADYDLLHYAGGLSMWRRLTKRNIGGQYGVPLRLMLKTSTSGSGRIVFPPTTFRRRHQPARPSSKHLKDNFMKKVFSSVIGYSADYDLLHYACGLSMWRTLTKRNIGGQYGVPLRLMLKKSTFAPACWRERHLGVIDMQRQCGHPQLFRTRAPGSWTRCRS